MRIIVSLSLVLFFNDFILSVTCLKGEFFSFSKEAVRRDHRVLREDSWRRREHPIARLRRRMLLSNDVRHLRTLQDETSSSTCNTDGSVNFESDDFNMVVFGDDTFGSMCTCSESTNYDEVLPALYQLDPTIDMTTFVDMANALIGSLYAMSEYQCVNNCETCLNDVCAKLDTRELSSTTNEIPNYTYGEIISGEYDVYSAIANATFSLSNCITFTGYLDGKICFGIDFDTVPIPFSDTPCSIEYNGVACNSCVIPSADFLAGGNCYTADCTNFDSSAMINSCNGTGFVGPFAFLGILETENVTDSTFTVGSCDGDAAPPPPIAPVAMPAPASATSTDPPAVVPVSSVSNPTMSTSSSVVPCCFGGWSMWLLLGMAYHCFRQIR